MQALSGRQILTVGDTTYVWEHLVLAGHLWGDWGALEERVRTGLACLARRDDLEEDDEDALDEAEVDAAAAEFRYARDLVAADDVEAWLENRGLTVDAWLDCIRRGLLLMKWSDQLAEIADEYEAEPEDVDDAIACEAICTGVAADLAARLAGRAAVHARAAAQGGERGDGVTADEVRSVLAAVPQGLLEHGLPGLPPLACRQRLDALARLEATWRRFTAAEVTVEALRARIVANRLEWTRLTVRTVTAPDRDTASEIALCVREDGADLAATATAAGLSAVDARWYLDEVDASLRGHVTGAEPGELLGPLPLEDAFILISVVGKVLPSETDPDVRARAERALLARTVDREVDDRVTWHATL